MRKLLGAMLVLSYGAAMGAECTSPSAVVWRDAESSLLWKTVRGPSIAVSVDWPDGAVTAVLSVVQNGQVIASDTLSDRTACVHSLSLDLPQTESDEALLELTLTYRDASEAALVSETRKATVGHVRGMNGQSCRVVSPLVSKRRWGAVGGSAVVPVYADTESVALDGDELALSGRPGWAYLQGLSADRQTLVLTSEGGESISVPVFAGVGGMAIILR